MFQIITSEFALNTKEVEKQIDVPKSFLERLFDPDPTIPLWVKTKKKTIKVIVNEPAMYLISNRTIISHPFLMDKVKKFILSNTQTSAQ